MLIILYYLIGKTNPMYLRPAVFPSFRGRPSRNPRGPCSISVGKEQRAVQAPHMGNELCSTSKEDPFQVETILKNTLEGMHPAAAPALPACACVPSSAAAPASWVESSVVRTRRNKIAVP